MLKKFPRPAPWVCTHDADAGALHTTPSQVNFAPGFSHHDDVCVPRLRPQNRAAASNAGAPHRCVEVGGSVCMQFQRAELAVVKLLQSFDRGVQPTGQPPEAEAATGAAPTPMAAM